MIWRATTVLAVLVGGLVAPQGVVSGQTAKRPDLVIKHATVSVTSQVPGGAFTGTDQTANLGKAKASSSTTGYVLSPAGPASVGAIRLPGRRSVPTLTLAKSSQGIAHLTLPSWAPTGSYHLFACADITDKVTESDEANNCREALVHFRVISRSVSGDLTLDARDSVSSVMTSQPGTLQTTDADGNSFTLSLPQGALLSPEKITMTPVLAISKLPGTKAALKSVGVRLEPSGLVLNQTATLKIMVAHPIPVARQHGLAFEGAGSQMHRMPLDPSTKFIQFDLAHFSGTALVEASAPELDALQSDVPASPDFQLENTLSAPVEEFRDGQETHNDLQNTLVDPIQKMFEDQILPGLKKAETIDLGNDGAEDATVAPVVVQALEWARQLTILGMGEFYGDDIAYIFQALGRIEAHQFKLAYTRCLANKNPRHELIRMISAMRQIQLSSDEAGLAQLLGADYWTKVDTCGGAYQLTMHGTSTETWKTTEFTLFAWKSVSATVHAEAVPLRIDDSARDGSFNGGGPETPLVVDAAKGTPWFATCKAGRRYRITSLDSAKSSIQARFWPDANLSVTGRKGSTGVLQMSPTDSENVADQCYSRSYPDGESVFNRAWQATTYTGGLDESFKYSGGPETQTFRNDNTDTTDVVKVSVALASR